MKQNLSVVLGDSVYAALKLAIWIAENTVPSVGFSQNVILPLSGVLNYLRAETSKHQPGNN